MNRDAPGAPEPLPQVRAAADAALAAGVWPEDVDWYLDRLEDLGLLLGAVPLTAVGSPRWAVPVGGSRRGGCVMWAQPGQGERVADLLAGRIGFPDVRVGHDLEQGGGMVCWGEDEPPTPAWEAPDLEWVREIVATGRLYGYRSAAIRAFAAERWGAALADEAMRHP
ncbi:DUF6302 family protein [Nocardia carnea]|uniref:DUF6302 family protein n=1 Tax=Nocardia carnea TaxID=37328 RepID=UPI0024578041|nr:DUF6302 family protein [Nocardia carnea]